VEGRKEGRKEGSKEGEGSKERNHKPSLPHIQIALKKIDHSRRRGLGVFERWTGCVPDAAWQKRALHTSLFFVLT